MKIESKDFKIENLFSKKTYIIPDYQRDYSWTINEEISIFWDDFIYYLEKKESNFFIGPMVFKGTDTNASKFEVIDGQQRLITFSILFSVLVSLFEEYGDENLSKGLSENSLKFKDKENKESLTIETMEPHPYFQEKVFHKEKDVKPEKDSEKHIEKAWNFFKEKIEEMLNGISAKNRKIDFLKNIRDYIFNIDTVIIVSDDETDAFTIFETINTRGKNLSSLDLLKNYIFKNYKKSTGIEEPKETWKKIISNITKGRDTFFNRFWASWVSKVTENKLYRRFNDHIRDSKNNEFYSTKILLEELYIASSIYRGLINPTIDDWKKNRNYQIYNHIKNINRLFNLKVHFPFFLALFEEYKKKNIDLKLLKGTLLLMENFHFVFTHIVSPRASGLDNKYSKFAIRLRKEEDKKKVIENLSKELSEKIPSEDEYMEKFKELDYLKNKDTVKFILLRLEKEKDPSLNIDFELHSIEHLEPKSNKAFKNVNNIGNLFLLEEKYNEDKRDRKPFDSFCEETVIRFLIENTKYKTTKKDLKEIRSEGEWTESSIEKRTKELGKKTYKLFSKL